MSIAVCWSHHAIRAAGQGAPGLRAALSREGVVALHLLPQQILQALYVLDGVPQDLHLGQPLAGIGRGAAAQRLEGMVHLLQPPALPHSGRSPAVHGARFTLAGFAGPLEAVSRLVWGPRGPDMLVLLRPRQLPGAELQGFWRGGAGAVVEDLGGREDLHG